MEENYEKAIKTENMLLYYESSYYKKFVKKEQNHKNKQNLEIELGNSNNKKRRIENNNDK